MEPPARSEPPRAPPGPRPIHIDTDPGLDDLLALALALASPELELRSLSTVAGNASLAAVTENALRFLALARCSLPVGRGAEGPLALRRTDATAFHGPDGRRRMVLPQPAPIRLGCAREQLAESLRQGVRSLVALGPLTNLAALWLETPDLLAGVELIWMGGTLGQGNVTPHAEFNAYADPKAAALLLGAGLRIRVVGLEVTTRVRVGFQDLAGGCFGSGPIGRTLEEMLRALCAAEAPDRAAVLHDPCAVAAAVRPEAFRFERVPLEVHVAEDARRGCLRRAPKGATVEYAREVEAESVRDLVLRRLAEWSDKLDAY